VAEVRQVPLSLITPHPKLATRLKLEVGSLAALIKRSVGEDVPNGQVEPGRVVPREDGGGYYVYIGVRRFCALKSICEETGDERFAVFNAYIDSGSSLLSLFLRVRSENEEGKGERVGLSVLEKILGLYKIRGSIPPEKLDDELRRELAVAEKLDEKRIMKLFEVETAAHFGYRLEHLERLRLIEDAEEFFKSAACTAGFSLPPEGVEKAVDGRDAANTLRWFGRVFPEYAKERQKRPSTGLQTSIQQQLGAGEHDEGEPDTNVRGGGSLEIHEKAVIMVPCPACGVENMVQTRLEAEVTRLSGDPNGPSMTAIPGVVLGCGVECYRCAKRFYVFIKPLGGRSYAVEVSHSARFREPRKVVEAVDIRFDFQKGTWQKLAGAKVIGVVRARARARN